MNKYLIMIITGGSILALAFGLWRVLGVAPSQKEESIVKPVTVSNETVTIIAFGDSLTAGYGLPRNESYPAQLEKKLIEAGYDVSVINSGVSGETTRGNLERAQFIRNQNPEVVLLGIGGNDALRLLPLSETKKNIRATVEILQSGENPPVIVFLKMQAPLNAGLEYKAEFDMLYEEIANEKNVTLVPFLTPEVFFDQANKLSDGIHFNKQGYAKVVDLYLFPEVTRVLNALIE